MADGTATTTSTEPVDPNVVGNFATALKDVTTESSASLRVLSELLGAVADIAGAVGAVGAIIGLVTSLFGGPDEVQQALQQILAAIQTAFKQLDKELGAYQVLQRNTTLNGYLATPLANIQTLQASLSDPPLGSDARTQQISECFSALQALSGTAMPDTIWNMDFNWIAFWTDKAILYSPTWIFSQSADAPVWQPGVKMDVGYGPQNPPLNADNTTVFNYNYSLPAYLLAASIFVTLGVAFDPDFRTSYATPLTTIISTLQTRHDQIYNTGFVTLVPQPWSQETLLYLGYNGTQGFVGPDVPPQFTDANGNTQSLPNGATLYFAVVERYSGASAMQTNYNVTLNLPGSDPVANTPDASYRKMQLRALHLRKQLYMFTGLTQVIAMQNKILMMLGQEQPSTPSLADWSIRRDLIPTMSFPASTPAGYSLGALAKHVRNIPPTDDIPSGSISLRTLFAGT